MFDKENDKIGWDLDKIGMEIPMENDKVYRCDVTNLVLSMIKEDNAIET